LAQTKCTVQSSSNPTASSLRQECSKRRKAKLSKIT